MIHVKSISLSFGNQTVFNDISCTIQQKQRIGLVGANGSGKSTLLKSIAGQQLLDKGAISIANNATIAYMPQEVVLQSEKSVHEEAISTFEKLYSLQQESQNLEQQIEKKSDQLLIDRYAHVHQELMHLNPHKKAIETKHVLTGLGFSVAQQNGPVAHLSVGWKMRLVLAKLLLKNADFYLFDEPTNHLDLVAKEWFLNFLKEASFGFLLVCHDRYFLDQLCERIIALEYGKAKLHRGNYSIYETLREQELVALQSAYEQQQRDIKQKQKTIDRFRAKASKAKMVKSMQKDLDRIELITLPPSIKNVSFSFPAVQRAGRIVLSAQEVSHAFGKKKIFKQVNFEVERGQKVALVAPNGTGKSTLFNLISGQLPLQTGTIALGYNVRHALFAQDQNESLDGNATILDNVQNYCPQKPEKLIRAFLGAFLFSGDDVDKKVKVLSGGEKNRVSMTCVLMQDANFLLLDEPTNHLDIQSKEILLKALQAYKGTILFVSHDRDFVNRLAGHILELGADETKMYHGNYESYLYQKQHTLTVTTKTQHDEARKAQKKAALFEKKEQYERKKQSKRIENKIDKLEQKISEYEFKFVELRYGTQEFQENQQTLQNLKEELQDLIKKWEALQQNEQKSL